MSSPRVLLPQLGISTSSVELKQLQTKLLRNYQVQHEQHLKKTNMANMGVNSLTKSRKSLLNNPQGYQNSPSIQSYKRSISLSNLSNGVYQDDRNRRHQFQQHHKRMMEDDMLHKKLRQKHEQQVAQTEEQMMRQQHQRNSLDGAQKHYNYYSPSQNPTKDYVGVLAAVTTVRRTSMGRYDATPPPSPSSPGLAPYLSPQNSKTQLRDVLLRQIQQSAYRKQQQRDFDKSAPYVNEAYHSVRHTIYNPVDFKVGVDNPYVMKGLKSFDK